MEEPAAAAVAAAPVAVFDQRAHDGVDGVVASGGRATYHDIDSPHGQDAFLIDTDEVAAALVPFLEGDLP